MKKAFDAAAKANKVYPDRRRPVVGALHPEAAPRNPATEFRYTQDVVAVPEVAAPKLGAAAIWSRSMPS